MKYAETIDCIRKLAKGNDSCDDTLSKILIKSGCHYLLSKSDNYYNKQVSSIVFNSVMINRRYQACKDIFMMLDGIPYVNIKGAGLSLRIYGNMAYRSSKDIDLLVPPEYLEQTKELLLSQGFVQGRLIDGEIVEYTRKELVYQRSFSHQLAPFLKKNESVICPFINIDVNFDIVWGEEKILVDISEFISHSEDFEIYGVKVRRLKPIYEFISLCMHNYKDMNSIYLIANRGLSLSEFCDIYFFLVNVAPNVDELAETARWYGVNDYVYYCIFYTNEIFADERLSVYLDKLYSNSVHKLINSYGLTDYERREWTIPFYDRLLDEHFKEIFLSTLTDSEKRKIQINRELM